MSQLSGNEHLTVGFGEVILHIRYPNGGGYMEDFMQSIDDLSRTDGAVQVKDIAEYYKHKIDRASKVTLFFNAPLWDKTFEYSKEENVWNLISEGKGFA